MKISYMCLLGVVLMALVSLPYSQASGFARKRAQRRRARELREKKLVAHMVKVSSIKLEAGISSSKCIQDNDSLHSCIMLPTFYQQWNQNVHSCEAFCSIICGQSTTKEPPQPTAVGTLIVVVATATFLSIMLAISMIICGCVFVTPEAFGREYRN